MLLHRVFNHMFSPVLRFCGRTGLSWMMGSHRSVPWKYFVVCEDDKSKAECTYVRFLFPSTTIRIRIRPSTAVNYLVFGRILKTHIRYSPIIVKAIYKAQNRLWATSVLCQQRKCLLHKQKGLQLCSKSLNRDISWSQCCRQLVLNVLL